MELIKETYLKRDKAKMSHIPKIAIIDPNTLSALGLKGILQNIIPMLSIDCFSSFKELSANAPEQYFHFFASWNIILENKKFFDDNKRKTIVLTPQQEQSISSLGFHCLCVNQPEHELVKSILMLEQHAHPHGANMPIPSTEPDNSVLSVREIEVLSLIVKGYINKEIASILNIGLPPVITHRRNIMEKLNAKSVSTLTIYAVMRGYVNIDSI